MNISEALASLRSGASWSISGDNYETLWWSDENELPPPSKKEVEAEVARLQAEQRRTEYQRLRSPEYPDLKEFVDAYYWAQKGDDTKMNAYIVKCDAVKDKYPKSE